MGFAGNLRTLSLVEVFQTINRIRATGALRLASSEAGRDVVFADGEIIGVAFRAGEEKLALLRRLILQGRIDATTASAISSSGKDSYVIMEALIQRGQLAAHEVHDAIQRQSEDELYNLSTWDYADFVFQDAGPEDPATTQLVEHFRAQPLKININSLLMESARRMDEWGRLREVIKSEDAVLGAADGRDQEMLKASQEYPGSAVVPLIDAVRTIEDIVHESVATRLDVYGVLAELIGDGLAAILTRDDILAHAEHLIAQRDHIRAARLYRRALAEQPDDRLVTAKLAECLEQLGESPEAASCFSQLALGHLGEGNHQDAISAAHRAVKLAKDDPRQHMILVRCLLEDGRKTEATGELRALVARYLALGQLEDARGTCLKILEIDPQNEDARREMARIFAQAEKDPDSEDVVVCVQCGHVNQREATSCVECDAPLRLTCQGCQRIVAVSDRICIFCGADPHAGGKRQSMGSPATTRIVGRGKKPVPGESVGQGSRFWKDKLEQGVKVARDLEAAGDLPGALRQWREVAKVNHDNPELLAHIRELETMANDQFAEKTIERGHRYRRGRRFWSALKAYRSALRTMPPNDPRVPRLQEIVTSTRRHHQRITVIYAAAFAAIGVFGGLVARPYILIHGFGRELERTAKEVELLEQAPAPASLMTLPVLDGEFAALDEQGRRLGKSEGAVQARIALQELQGRLTVARGRIAEKALITIQSATEKGDLAAAEQQLAAFRTALGPDFMSVRLRTAQEHLAAARLSSTDAAAKRRDAPEQLAKAKELEQRNVLGEAIGIYRAVALLQHEGASPAAKEALARLEPKEKEFVGAWNQAGELMVGDLGKADAALSALAEAARVWGRGDELAKRKAAITERLRAAGAAYQALGANATHEALEQFVASYAGAPQVAQARVRLDQLQQAQRTRDDQLAGYRAAMGAKRYEQAWQIARNLFAGGGALPEDLALPVVIDSAPAGAEVTVGGKARGRTPCMVAFAPAEAKLEVVVSHPDWNPATRLVTDVVADWRWQAALVRKPQWQGELGKPVTLLQAQADGGFLALAGEVLHRLDRAGKPVWRTSIGGSDDLGDNARSRLAHGPLVLPDGRLALGLPGHDVVILAQDTVAARIVSATAVRGQPVLYTNDLLGGSQRLAFAAEALVFGDVGAEPTRVALQSPALSGPVVVTKGADRVLVVANLQGQLVGYEESSRQRKWQFDLKATDVGQLIQIGDLVVTILDGSRLAGFQVSATGASARWSVPLNAPAVGEPVIVAGGLCVSAGAAIIRVGLDGVAAPPLPLPGPACTMAAAGGDLLAAGSRNGTVTVYRRGVLLWSTACQALPGAIACNSDAVVVGMVDGTLAAYSP
jgi:tetratricopeptide (TPR) repeat protein